MAEMFANAIGHEHLMGRWSARLAPLYANFAQLRDAGRIPDVGCGTGAMARTIASMTRSSEIVGVDASQSFVEYGFGGETALNNSGLLLAETSRLWNSAHQHPS